MTHNIDDLISVREAARQCGRNMETVRRWIWGGKLPAEKLGNQLFIKMSDFASFCRETAVQAYKIDRVKSHGNIQKHVQKRAGAVYTPADDNEDIRAEHYHKISRSLNEMATKGNKIRIKSDFLERSITLRNKIYARTGRVFDAESMIRELRNERDKEIS